MDSASVHQVRAFRLRSHHLDAPLPAGGIEEAAGACGVQNSPPGAWETAMFNRVSGCSVESLHEALYDRKSLIQAWSFRGAPFVFPTSQSDAFLTPLIAREGEWPWIYTLGITGALDYLRMEFDDLLRWTMEAARYLDTHTVTSKEALDAVLADIVEENVPESKRELWRSPSMYGNPEKQTVGQAAVSFLLRPCSFHGLVVFGKREGSHPAFTSYRAWTGSAPDRIPDAEKALVRKFLRCYGPSTPECFEAWLGCSRKQAKRLWGSVTEEMEPIEAGGKPAWILAADQERLIAGDDVEAAASRNLLLLGPHDPYLDARDRSVILEDASRHKAVWKYVGNPGVVLKRGCIVGTWKAKKRGRKLDISLGAWEPLRAAEKQQIEDRAEAYAAFRGLELSTLA